MKRLFLFVLLFCANLGFSQAEDDILVDLDTYLEGIEECVTRTPCEDSNEYGYSDPIRGKPVNYSEGYSSYSNTHTYSDSAPQSSNTYDHPSHASGYSTTNTSSDNYYNYPNTSRYPNTNCQNPCGYSNCHYPMNNCCPDGYGNYQDACSYPDTNCQNPCGYSECDYPMNNCCPDGYGNYPNPYPYPNANCQNPCGYSECGYPMNNCCPDSYGNYPNAYPYPNADCQNPCGYPDCNYPTNNCCPDSYGNYPNGYPYSNETYPNSCGYSDCGYPVNNCPDGYGNYPNTGQYPEYYPDVNGLPAGFSNCTGYPQSCCYPNGMPYWPNEGGYGYPGYGGSYPNTWGYPCDPCSGYNCSDSCLYNRGAVPGTLRQYFCNACRHFNIGLSALYWKASRDDREYSQTSTDVLGRANFTLRTDPPQFAWGWRIKGEYVTDNNSFIFAEYTSFKETSRDTTEATNFNVADFTFVTEPLREMSMRVTTRYQRARAAAGWYICNGCCGSLYAFGGAGWLRLYERDRDVAITPTNVTFTFKQSSNYSAAAFDAGLGGKFFILSCLGIKAEMNAVAAIGRRTFSEDVTSNQPVGPAPFNNYIYPTSTKLAPGLEMCVEAFWSRICGWPCTLAVGYEHHHFFNPIVLARTFATGTTNGFDGTFIHYEYDLGFGGVYITARFCY